MIRDLYIKAVAPCPNGTVTITDNNDQVIGTQDVASGGVATYVVTDLPCALPTERWKIGFRDTQEVQALDVQAGDIYTFTSGSGANIGTMSVSTDDITYTLISYPFTPTLGMNYFKRGDKLVTATYIMI